MRDLTSSTRNVPCVRVRTRIVCVQERGVLMSEHEIPELVSEVYKQAPAPLRAKLLECLLRPVGPLALVAIAAGVFGRFLHRLTGDAVPISLDDAARITSDHVLDLARYVQQCSPDALLQIGSPIAARPIGLAHLHGPGLVVC